MLEFYVMLAGAGQVSLPLALAGGVGLKCCS